ncbi:AAA family ATPase [Sphingopyxis sp.]|uniref:AAA family ATPase n=1 Tax=Sphingopyxis sp. TaxID=1908224 RepID=UPI00260E06D7|nr:AAA family ATPase [Sphingopyxis sp.]MCW0198874.1 ATP-binding protein [Sphingopyxis sp.]
MAFEIDWQFIREFHPLPNSDRRLLLKALGIETVSNRDDDSFYHWLAEYYRAGTGPLLDEAIRRSSAKPDERSLDALLRQWLIGRTGFPRRRRYGNTRAQIRTMLAGLDPDCEVARQVDALLPNFPWLLDERAGRPLAAPASGSTPIAADTDDHPERPEGPGPASPTEVLDRLAAAVEAMRAHPEPALVEWAGALAEAIEAHLAASSRAEEDAAALAERRAAVKAMLAGLDSVIAARIGTVPVDAMTIDMVDRMENTLASLDGAHAALGRAQEAWRLAAMAGKAERDAATAEFDRAESERDAALDRLEQALTDCVAELGDAAVEEELPLFAAVLPDDAAAAAAAAGAGDGEAGASPQVDDASSGYGEERAEVAADSAKGNPADDGSDEWPDVEEATVEDALADSMPCEGAATEPVREVTPLTEPVPLAEADFDTAPAARDEPDAPDEPQPQLPRWEEWIAAALEGKRYGLAVHLADGRRLSGAELPDSLPAPVIEALLTGNGVHTAFNKPWVAYQELAEAVIAIAKNSNGQPTDLLLLAGAMRPAMLQSDTAMAVIDALDGGIGAAFKPLRRVIQNVATLRLVHMADLAAAPDQEEKHRRASDIKDRLTAWRAGAPTRKTNYQPATAVWQELVSPAGTIGRAFQLALAGKGDALSAVRSQVALLEDEDAIIDGARSLLAKGIRRDAIEGVARKQIRGLIGSATELLREWIAVNEEIGRTDDPHHSHRTALVGAIAQSREILEGLDRSTPLLDAAIATFDAVLTDLDAQLRGTAYAPLYPDVALDSEIALLAHFPLNARRPFRVLGNDVEDLARAAEIAFSPALPTIASAFEEALRLGAASSAKRLLPSLDPRNDEADVARVAASVVRSREELAERKRRLRQSLDDLQIASTSSSSALDELEGAMTSFEQLSIGELPLDIGEPGAIADFPAANAELDRIARSLEKIRAPQRASLEVRILALETLYGPLEDCRAQLERGDLGTLAEEVDQIEKHGIADAAESAPLSLLRRFAELLKAAGDKPSVPIGNLPKAAREGDTLELFDFTALKPLDRERSTRLLEAWNMLRRTTSPGLRRDKRGDPLVKVGSAAADVLAALGFNGVRAKDPKRDKSWFQFSMATLPLRDREICPVATFGSERVNGNERDAHYPVIVVSPGEIDACIGSFDQLPEQAIILFTDPLDARQRRDLQRKARRSTRSIAVADTMTIAALATTRDAGTRQFFELAIPYGSSHTYSDTSSDTAIENFFGRDTEMRALVDSRGPCFVYGGRQLGKTALLKQIELRENGNDDRVALYCYIKPVGDTEGADDVWKEIQRRVQARGMVLPKAASIQEQLKAWVLQKAGRYLLIMLDEADAFLAGEMKANFPIIEQMKAMMEDTQRAIKFVFAGLHNVQRFYRAPNSPLLHLGLPVNVGPLLGGDRVAARQMAIAPMAALGFEFEDQIDAYHMLSLIGFYPSLMQSFGKAVVTAMNAQLGRSSGPVSMPFRIKRDVIDACFNQQTFRTSVVRKLQKTLELDERYELITYAVWSRMQDDSVAGLSTAFGYTAFEISRLSREWWPAGFAETESLESFTAILDEMEEMGVLARKGDLYALRSQRIAAMLGGKTEIESRMQELIERPPTRSPDPLSSHRRMGARWSPLALRQEAALVKHLTDPAGPRIFLIGAAPAAGLDRLGDAINELIASPAVPLASPRRLKDADAATIIEVAGRQRREASPEAPRILLVEGQLPAADGLALLRRDRVFRETQRPVRLVLCGTPTVEIAALPPERDLLSIQIGPLSLETIAHWMSREEFPEDERIQSALRAATGGWLDVLERAPVTPAVRKRGADAMIEMISAAAGSFTAADLGLDAEALEFARALLKAQGGGGANESEMADWAMIVDEAAGAARLRLLDALGIVETLPTSGETAVRAFNSLAARLLA